MIGLIVTTFQARSAPPDTTIKGLILTDQQRRMDAQRTEQIRLFEDQRADANEARINAINRAHALKIANVETRDWSDSVGEFSVPAKLININKSLGKITLLRQDGKEMKVTIVRLSQEDQKFVREEIKRHDGEKKGKK
jgi:hypothetical protein